MKYQQMKSVIEGAICSLQAMKGWTLSKLRKCWKKSKETVKDLLHDLKNDFRREGRGIQIVRSPETYQMTTLPEHAPYFERLAYSPSHATLSQAALETLAIVAYKQPITRIEIEEIRGVKSDRPVQTLVAKQLIQEVARADVIGRPILYGTTKQFLIISVNGHLRSSGSTDFDAATLAEQTRDLFDKIGDMQMTIDDLDERMKL